MVGNQGVEIKQERFKFSRKKALDEAGPGGEAIPRRIAEFSARSVGWQPIAFGATEHPLS
jgi:hypothetical protein